MTMNVIDLRNPTWPIAVIREALDLRDRGELPDVDARPDEVEGARPADAAGRSRTIFIEHQLNLVWRVAWWADCILGKRPPQEMRLEVALVLAGASECWPQLTELASARSDLRRAGSWADGRLNELLAGQVPAIGQRLLAGKLGDHDTLLDTPFHHALMHGELRLVERLAFELYTGRLTRDRVQEHLARAQVERLSYVEAVIGLVWADKHLARSERRLVEALAAWAGFSDAERKLLRRHLNKGDVEADHIAGNITDPQDRRSLLRTLMIAALIDGEYSPDEQRWIESLAGAFGVDSAEVARLHDETDRLLSSHKHIRRGLTTTGLMHRSLRITQAQVEAAVRRNLGALLAEVRETGDLVALLAKSTQEPLTDDENERMRAQLVDICRTIPALAVFAAPGGAVMLPILQRLLPFSLFPSSFRHDDERL